MALGASAPSGGPTCPGGKSPLPEFAFVLDAAKLSALTEDTGVAVTDAADPGKPTCWTVHLENVDAGYDTVSRDWFAGAVGQSRGKPFGVFPVAACMSADIRVDYVASGASYDAHAVPAYSARLRLINPVRLRLFPLPQDGEISMHPICGADITDTASDAYKPYFDAASAALSDLKPASGNSSKPHGQ
jgi:hypothetical protein